MTVNILTTLFINAAVFAVLFGLMLLMRKLLWGRISARLQYLLWAVVVLKLIVPFGFESALSPFGLFAVSADNAVVTETAGWPATAAYAPDTVLQLESMSQPQTTTDAAKMAAASVQNQSTADVPADETAGTAKPEPIDWTAWVLALWAAGVLAAGTIRGLCALNLRRSIRHARVAPAVRVMTIFEQCRQQLGIKRRVAVVTQSALCMPVIMGAVHPTLVLPDDIGAQDDAAIRHICMHELAHVKHGDLIVLLALNILGAVYWFNPFVWLCFRLVRKDMETACDQRTLGVLGNETRQDYIGTVLQYAARTQQRRLYAAIGMAYGRGGMETRIRGMFRKTKAGGRLAAVCVAAVMLATCVLTACQPTPEEEVIVNKGDGEFEEAINATAAPAAAYEAPGHWSETVENGKLTIAIDTDVTLPDVSVYPVVKLEPATFSQQRLDELVAYFAGDNKLYEPEVMTKADYEEKLVEAKKGDLIDGEYVITEQSLAYVEELEKKIANAPEDSPRVYADTTLTYRKDENGNADTAAGENFFCVTVENKSGNDASIYAGNYVEGYNTSTSFSYTCGGGYETASFFMPEDVEWIDYETILAGINISEADAAAQAQNIIDDLGIEDMVLDNAEKAILYDETNRGGYAFEYIRESGGIAGYQRTSWSTNAGEAEPAYSPPFFQERVAIVVTENGVEYFSWTGCAQVVETVSGNVPLLAFEKIQQDLKDQIYYKKSFELDREGLEELTVTVNSAGLRVGYISVENNVHQALLVPVWVFEVSETVTYYGETYEVDRDVYIFNAIDGGVIGSSYGTAGVIAEEEAILAGEEEEG
ncbi:MAG: DUF6034 family protein [Eubacteriales bacterium]|nr:DUF6034 family protein [Eubacteriales bacterium]